MREADRGDAVVTFSRERAGFGHEVRRLHEKLFYRPLLAAVARLPAEEARLTPAAAQARHAHFDHEPATGGEGAGPRCGSTPPARPGCAGFRWC